MSAYDLVFRGGTIVDGTGKPGFAGDIAVKDGLIAQVGKVTGSGAEELDATGLIVTPGFVDIHTHYDGQATWDQEMAPSSWHGVTTVVMGNCGVGFAPAKADRHEWLIQLMEGVEDIPGTALAEGITWDWETFPEYLDALEKLPRTVDIGTHVPHGAARAYVLGDREAPGAVPTSDDIAQMAQIVEDGVRAGALGFSTSRTVLHKDVNGVLVPGTTATANELIEIGRAMGRVGHGVFEMASDLRREWNEFEWMGALSRETGLPVTFAALQSIAKELPLDEQIATMRAENDNGANIVAQIALRGNGIDDTVNSLSDGGAHCGTICDAASPTFMLQHWVRDRKRGDRITLENAVKRQCYDTARLYGLHDRRVLAPGMLADINLIDLDRLKLGKPWLAFDLPAGGKPLLQKADGYVATIKNGAVTFRGGTWTGATPGGLIRGPQRAEQLEAAE